MFPKVQPCNAHITLRDGRKFSTHLEWPKGDYRSPMSEDELDEKVTALMKDRLSARASQTLRDRVFSLEKLARVDELMTATRCDL
jgi:2-methylcitrate dehydratase PrpD